MRFDFRVIGDPEEILRREVRNGERAVTRGVGAAGRGLKADWRQQIKGAGLGTRLGNTIRANLYPEGRDSLNAASLVFSRASKIVDANDRGALIRSKNGFWLAIPTDAVKRLRGAGNKRISPTRYELKTGNRLRFVYRRGKPSLLVVDQARIDKRGTVRRKGGRRRKDGILTGEQTVVAFILVPQVKLKKRLDLDRDATKWLNRLPRMIVDRWKD